MRRGAWMAAIVVGAVALRLAFALGYWVDKPLTLDEQEYLLLAHNLAGGRGFSYVSPTSGRVEGRHVGRAPLYPLFLAGVALAVPGSGIRADRLPSSTPIEIKVVQALLGGLVVWLIGRWAARAVGEWPGIGRASLVASTVAALYPPLIWIGSYVLSESLYAALALASAWIVDRAVAERTSARGARLALAAGAVAGLATLTRPAMLVFLALVALWLIAARRPGLLVAVALGAALVIAPWTARNQRAYGHFVLVASEGGVTFWTGNSRLATGEGDLASNAALKLAALDIERANAGATPEALESVFYRAAVRDILDRPLSWVRLIARKAFFAVVPIGPSYTQHSLRFVTMSIGSYLALLPFAAAGAWRLRNRAGQPIALWLLAGASVLVCLVFFPQERFRVPTLDPVLIVCAACLASGASAREAAARP
jgi:4-amino-4-deoxy-L-arabinose transferase-like glycosyltransferase